MCLDVCGIYALASIDLDLFWFISLYSNEIHRMKFAEKCSALSKCSAKICANQLTNSFTRWLTRSLGDVLTVEPIIGAVEWSRRMEVTNVGSNKWIQQSTKPFDWNHSIETTRLKPVDWSLVDELNSKRTVALHRQLIIAIIKNDIKTILKR